MYVYIKTQGSLLVRADRPLGHYEEPDSPGPILTYSDHNGRVRLERVRVINKGIDRSNPKANEWWKGRLQRNAKCEIVLQGRAEFEAKNVDIVGDASFVVPDGYKMTLTASHTAPTGTSPRLFVLQ